MYLEWMDSKHKVGKEDTTAVKVTASTDETRYWEKVSLWLLCSDYLSIIADGISVSIFLCTRKAEEVQV